VHIDTASKVKGGVDSVTNKDARLHCAFHFKNARWRVGIVCSIKSERLVIEKWCERNGNPCPARKSLETCHLILNWGAIQKDCDHKIRVRIDLETQIRNFIWAGRCILYELNVKMMEKKVTILQKTV